MVMASDPGLMVGNMKANGIRGSHMEKGLRLILMALEKQGSGEEGSL